MTVAVSGDEEPLEWADFGHALSHNASFEDFVTIV